MQKKAVAKKRKSTGRSGRFLELRSRDRRDPEDAVKAARSLCDTYKVKKLSVSQVALCLGMTRQRVLQLIRKDGVGNAHYRSRTLSSTRDKNGRHYFSLKEFERFVSVERKNVW